MTTIASDIATWTPAVSTPKARPLVIEYAGNGAFIYVPTDDVQESRRTVDDTGRTVGGCHVCGQDIEGEDARYYAATVRLAGRPNPGARGRPAVRRRHRSPPHRARAQALHRRPRVHIILASRGVRQ